MVAPITEAAAAVILRSLPGVGAGRYRRLLREFGSASGALAAPPSIFARLAGEEAGSLRDDVARRHLEEIESKIRRLRGLRRELRRMVEGCAGGRVEGCRVVQVLSDHRLCASRDHGSPDD